MNDGFKNLVISGLIHKAIRGEEFRFFTPPQKNGELLPTDHNELLSKAIYPLCDALGVEYVLRALEDGLRDAASDAVGVYCAIQCYYNQIISEEYGESPFSIDRINLPIFLGEQLKKDEPELLALRLSDYDSLGDRLGLTLAAMEILRDDEGINFRG